MSAVRQPTKILEARGYFKTNPARKRPNEPQVKAPFPRNAPRHLDAGAKRCWKELVKIIPDGVLTAADVVEIELIANLLSEYREDPKTFPINKLGRLSTEMTKVGLSPSSRAALTVETTKEKDDFSEF